MESDRDSHQRNCNYIRLAAQLFLLSGIEIVQSGLMWPFHMLLLSFVHQVVWIYYIHFIDWPSTLKILLCWGGLSSEVCFLSINCSFFMLNHLCFNMWATLLLGEQNLIVFIFIRASPAVRYLKWTLINAYQVRNSTWWYSAMAAGVRCVAECIESVLSMDRNLLCRLAAGGEMELMCETLDQMRVGVIAGPACWK